MKEHRTLWSFGASEFLDKITVNRHRSTCISDHKNQSAILLMLPLTVVAGTRTPNALGQNQYTGVN